jgi:PHD/YefM family antitoxin component YafN of YafNO toxin-antitoxin module
MKTITHVSKTDIAKKSVVVIPLEQWKEIETELEDLEMLKSETYRKKISISRKEKKMYSAGQIKKILKI